MGFCESRSFNFIAKSFGLYGYWRDGGTGGGWYIDLLPWPALLQDHERCWKYKKEGPSQLMERLFMTGREEEQQEG